MLHPSSQPRIAIIGAGIAGLTAAQILHNHADVTLIEKSRGVGGRMTTRYADLYEFDHGAPYFTVRDPLFRDYLAPYLAQGIIGTWNPHVLTLEKGQKPYKRDWFEDHYVGTPKMNSLCKFMASGLDIRLMTEVSCITKENNLTWSVYNKDKTLIGEYDWVISTAPSHQAQKIMPIEFTGHAALQKVSMVGCYSLMIGIEQQPALNFEAAVIKNSPLSWIAVNSQKPQRNNAFSLLAHTSNEWAETHLEDDQQELQSVLTHELCELLNISLKSITHSALHRWRYADTKTPLGEDYILDIPHKLATCGDWCRKSRIEDAFLSAHALSQRLLSML